MNFEFNTSLIVGYHSPTQKARVLTEDWLGRNMYCPICGEPILTHFEANRPVADFYCKNCLSEYELKSKERIKKGIGDKIVDGEFHTMIDRITACNNPNFFFLTHYNNIVRNLVLIPNHFFVPSIIEKRKPLSENARRAGWTGCNINLTSIPQYGKIFIVQDSKEIDHNIVLDSYKKIKALKTDSLESRGWLIDVLQCVDKLGNEFTLDEMYSFTNFLQLKYPENNFVQPKIRQQLQLLRDKGFVEFTKRGHYKKNKIMNEYIFYTTEGYTYPPKEDMEIENCQVLGRAYGETAKEAKVNLLQRCPWIQESGFDIEEIICKQLLNNETKEDIRTIVQYLFVDEHRHFYESEEPSDHIYHTLLRLKEACN